MTIKGATGYEHVMFSSPGIVGTHEVSLRVREQVVPHDRHSLVVAAIPQLLGQLRVVVVELLPHILVGADDVDDEGWVGVVLKDIIQSHTGPLHHGRLRAGHLRWQEVGECPSSRLRRCLERYTHRWSTKRVRWGESLGGKS